MKCLCVCQVISGHQGWVRCVDVEPGNEWFVTGAADRMIKVRLIFHTFFPYVKLFGLGNVTETIFMYL